MGTILADGIILFHGAFVLFAVFGGFLVLRWPRWRLVHLPAVAWAALVEWAGWTCPLTFLEEGLRRTGAGPSLPDFLGRAVGGWIYPAGLTRQHQILLGFAVVGFNLAVYGWLAWRNRKRR
jgi:hypothetical protein